MNAMGPRPEMSDCFTRKAIRNPCRKGVECMGTSTRRKRRDAQECMPAWGPSCLKFPARSKAQFVNRVDRKASRCRQ